MRRLTAALLMPAATITNPATHNPTMDADTTTGSRRALRLESRAYDPDTRPGTAALSMREATTLRASVRAQLPPDVNRAPHSQDAHVCTSLSRPRR
jgi:hypothetical protein